MKQIKKIFLTFFLSLVFIIPIFSNIKTVNAASCTPVISIGASLGSYNGWPIMKLTMGGEPVFCLDGSVTMNGTNNCSEYYYWEGVSTSIEKAKVIIAYKNNPTNSMYVQAQKYFWGCSLNDLGELKTAVDNLGSVGGYTNYYLSFNPSNPYALGAEFTLSDSNGNFGNHSDKYSIASYSPGLVVSRNGNSIYHKVTQPYPLTKTVKINGKTEGGASLTEYRFDRWNAPDGIYGQDFAVAGGIDIKEYVGTTYSIKMPTGSLFFQKKDSFNNNVYNNYCKDTHLCINENADATNNTFRLLIDNTSPYWGTNADTGAVVNVNGKTFHVFQTENGTASFKTNASGQIIIENLLIGHYYLQEISVNEEVFILNEELVEFDIKTGATTNASMKNINLFGDIDLQKYDEFANKGLNNTYNKDASGNGFKFKYIETLGKEIFKGKSFNLPEGTVKINDDNYLEINGESVFYTNSNGYIHVCDRFNSTKNLCVPFGSWKMEEVAVQNEFELNNTIVDVTVNVGEKTSLDFTNNYRDVTLKVYKQDKANEEMVEGATYAFYDIDKYNIGDTSKGLGNLYGDAEKEIFNSINKNDNVNFYDHFVSKNGFNDYNYVYEFVTNPKQAPDKYIGLSANSEILTGKTSGKTTVKVSQQLLDLYGTIQDRYYYIGDHTFNPYEDFNFYLDENKEIPITIREKSYTIIKKTLVPKFIMADNTVTISLGDYTEHEEELNISIPGTKEILDDTVIFNLAPEAELSPDEFNEHIIKFIEILGEDKITYSNEQIDKSYYEETPLPTLNDMWDIEGTYIITYTVVDEARHKWTFSRNLSYTDDHNRVCEYNAVLNKYVWGDTKEICKDIETENPEVKRAPEEYNYDKRLVLYDPTVLLHLVEGEEESTYIGEFTLYSMDKLQKPELGQVGEVEHYYNLGEYTTNENGEIVVEGLKHSRTYMMCEILLPQSYTYDETENVCFVIPTNYESGQVLKVNTKNNELSDILIKTTATWQDNLKEKEFDGKNAIIVDTIKYMGLKDYINQEVTFKGSVISFNSGDVLTTSEKTFTVENPKNTFDMQFEFFPRPVTENYVVYEELYDKDNNLIAFHKDISDVKQTVHITGPNNYFYTELSGHEFTIDINNVILYFIDNVHYSGAVPGTKNKFYGYIVNVDTGEPAILDGKLLDSTYEWIAEDTEGTIAMPFNLRTYLNKEKNLPTGKYVVFQEWYIEDTLVFEDKRLINEPETFVFINNYHEDPHVPDNSSSDNTPSIIVPVPYTSVRKGK